MKSIIFLNILFLFNFHFNYSQTTLPSVWSFSQVNYPKGWYANGTNFYTGSGNSAPACKFDTQGDNLIISFLNEPSTLQFYIGGYLFSGGEFIVEESNDSLLWNVNKSFKTLNSSYQKNILNLAIQTRFVRFRYLSKIAGNVGIDDVEINPVNAINTAKISIYNDTIEIYDQSIIQFSSPLNQTLSIQLKIENKGIDPLILSSFQLIGQAKSDYTFVNQLDTVNSLDVRILEIDFRPSEIGDRNTFLKFKTNSVNADSISIFLNGIGGNFSTEPQIRPSILLFSEVKTYRFKGELNSGNTSDGNIVLICKNTSSTDTPVDGLEYQKGDFIGSSQVLLVGKDSVFYPNNVEANTTYCLRVFSYNGSGKYINYLNSNPLVASVLTPYSMQSQNYYNLIDPTSNNFISEIHHLINPHKMQLYADYANLMMDKFYLRDTFQNQKVVTCVYSGENKIVEYPFDFVNCGYSREHTFCHSWMPTNPSQGLPEFNDYHHLFPTNQNLVNAVRSNYPLGEVKTLISNYLESKLGYDLHGKMVFEPRDSHKGDAARALFYESICYNGVNNGNWVLPVFQDVDILKKWHFEDPPNNREMARNDFIDSLQGNRNPFIDHPEWVCKIDFSSLIYFSGICENSLIESNQTDWVISFDQEMQNVSIDFSEYVNGNYKVVDVKGVVLESQKFEQNDLLKISISDYDQGIYIIRLETDQGSFSKFIVKK